MFFPLVALMSVVWVDLLFAAVMLAIGMVAGWWLFRSPGGSGAQAADTREAAQRIRELVDSVSQDVGAHNSIMQSYNSELSEATAGEDKPINDLVLGTVTGMIEANEKLQSQLAAAESKLKKQAEEIELHVNDARTDQLTGINNRRAFDLDIAERHEEWQRVESPYSVVMIDVDHFKKFNDTHGHQAGDDVLRGVARVLRQTVRRMDIVCRYGGEEFSLILPSTDLGVARRLADRARQAIEAASFHVQGQQLKVTTSIGVGEVDGEESHETLVKRADEALYAAKKAGRNRVYYHDGQDMHPHGIDPPAEQAPTVKEVSRTVETPSNRPSEAKKPQADVAATPTLERLPDAASFKAELGRRLAEAQRYQVPICMLTLRVDDVQTLRKQFGDEVADLVYDTSAQYLELLLRDMDSLAKGDPGVFYVLLPGSQGKDAVRVAQRIVSAMAACAVPIGEESRALRLSLGVAELEPQDEAATLMDRARRAMLSAAADGTGKVYLSEGDTCRPAEAAELAAS